MLLAASGTVSHEITPIGTVVLNTIPTNDPGGYLELFSSWVEIATYAPQPVSDVTKLINRLVESTGWSNRQLASVIGTTHPTIQSMRRGREPERKPALAEALYRTAEVVDKISRLADNNQTLLKAVLNGRAQRDRTILQLLSEGEYAKAYLAALDLVGRSQVSDLLGTRQLRTPGREVGLIFDDDSSE